MTNPHLLRRKKYVTIKNSQYKAYFKRQFLNPKYGRAYSNMSFHNSKTLYKEDRNDAFSGTYELGDCGDSIHLEFDFSSEKQRKRRLYKVNAMLRDLQALKEAIENHDLTYGYAQEIKKKNNK